jgi:hypothetical protein
MPDALCPGTVSVTIFTSANTQVKADRNNCNNNDARRSFIADVEAWPQVPHRGLSQPKRSSWTITDNRNDDESTALSSPTLPVEGNSPLAARVKKTAGLGCGPGIVAVRENAAESMTRRRSRADSRKRRPSSSAHFDQLVGAGIVSRVPHASVAVHVLPVSFS